MGLTLQTYECEEGHEFFTHYDGAEAVQCPFCGKSVDATPNTLETY